MTDETPGWGVGACVVSTVIPPELAVGTVTVSVAGAMAGTVAVSVAGAVAGTVAVSVAGAVAVGWSASPNALPLPLPPAANVRSMPPEEKLPSLRLVASVKPVPSPPPQADSETIAIAEKHLREREVCLAEGIAKVVRIGL